MDRLYYNDNTPFEFSISVSDIEEYIAEYQEEIDKMVEDGATLRDVRDFLSSERYELSKIAFVNLPKEVTFDDYWYETSADFELVRGGDWKEMMEAMKSSPDFEWHQSPKSDSQYFLNLKNGDVYRYSDHWGKCASCHWELNPHPWSVYHRLGVANIKDFRRIWGVRVADKNKKEMPYYAAAEFLYFRYGRIPFSSDIVLKNMQTTFL